MLEMWAAVSFCVIMWVEYNIVLLVKNYMSKIPWFCKHFVHKEIHTKIFERFSKSALANLNPKVKSKTLW